jgi:signal transduction histidine kinase
VTAWEANRMAGQDGGGGVMQRVVNSFAAVLAVVLAVAAVLLDWNTWVELNVSVLYSIPLVLAAAARNRRLLWSLTAALIGVSFVVYLDQIPPHVMSAREPFLIDRALSAVSLLLSATILDAWVRSIITRALLSRSVEEQNARLGAINSDLLAHKEAIYRQNEELARQRGEIEEISRRKTQMLASISHDIRSPIQAIVLLAEVIGRTAEKLREASDIPALAGRVQANATGVADFLSEIIDMASFDAGRIDVKETDFLLSAMIKQQHERLLPMAQTKGVELIAAVDASLRLRTDRGKLGRIVGNLLANAIKFTSAGSVSIESGPMQDGGVFISVTDSGRGMRPEEVGRVLGELKQFEWSSERPGDGGWGLGLPISLRMAQLLGGGIDVQSEPEKGSVFTLFLPPSCVIGSSSKEAEQDKRNQQA